MDETGLVEGCAPGAPGSAGWCLLLALMIVLALAVWGVAGGVPS